MLSSVFVYGTLMSPDVVRVLLGRIPQRTAPAFVSEFQRYPVLGQEFPGMIRKEGGRTDGVVIEDLSLEEMKILDWFEGDEYVRQSVTVQWDDGVTRKVESFVWNNPWEELDMEKEWDYQHFCETTLQWYLANTVRPCRMEMDDLGVGKKSE